MRLSLLLVLALVTVATLAASPPNPPLSPTSHSVVHTPSPRLIPKRAAAVANHVAIVCVLLSLSAVFAGLTMGIMGFDTLSLEIIAESGPKPDCTYAQDILPIRKHGHQTLCTLILANMLANVLIVQEMSGLQDSLYTFIHEGPQETLLGEDNASAIWAFIINTLIILIFTEILPMSLCKSKFALKIASTGVPIARIAMVMLWPVAMPLGKLLDAWLPHDVGQVYDRNELKKLMMLHYESHAERSGLQHTEVKLLVAAMEFHEKTVKQVMTPIEQVFAVNCCDVLTADIIERLWRSGRSRVPVVNDAGHYCDILLVRDLITFSRGVSLTVGDVVAAKTRNVPTVDEDTPLQSMLVFFQRVNTHMAIVHSGTNSSGGAAIAVEGSGSKKKVDTPPCSTPGSPTTATQRILTFFSSMVAPVEEARKVVGIITLEDVVEELIREEIYDEYDSDNIYEECELPVAPNTLAATLSGSTTNGGSALRIPRPPRRRPRANFYSYYVRDKEDIELSESQVWSAAYYLIDMCPAFSQWRVGYVKYLLDEIGTIELRPDRDHEANTSGVVSPVSQHEHETNTSCSSSVESPNSSKRSDSKRTLFHQHRPMSGNVPSHRGTFTIPVTPTSAAPHPFGGTVRLGSNRQDEAHQNFTEGCREEMILYRKGVASQSMTLILSGGVDILVGRDGFMSRYRSFQTLAEDAVLSEIYVPEFTAVVRMPTRVYRIPRNLYDALSPAATYRHGAKSWPTRPFGVDVSPLAGPRLVASRQSWANLNVVVEAEKGSNPFGTSVANDLDDEDTPQTALLLRGKAYGTFANPHATIR